METVARTYWLLAEIERTFRVMKTDLGLRPINHSKDERIEGHLFITVLAYHAAHLVRTKLKPMTSMIAGIRFEPGSTGLPPDPQNQTPLSDHECE